MKPAALGPVPSNGNEFAATPFRPTDLENGTRVVRANGFDPYADVYAEWDDATTIAAIEEVLLNFGDVVRLEAREDWPDRLREAKPDIVFNIAEGIGGATRESYVPTFCEFWGVPYTGSDPLTLATCLDKARAKEVLSFHGVPTPDFIVARRPTDLERWMHEPCVVKPLHEGSSKGIRSRSFCTTRAEATAEVDRVITAYTEPAIVERYLPGREFTVAILGDGETARALPIVELDFGTLPSAAPPIYSFEAKWIWDRPESPLDIFKCPADCEPQLQQRIEELALTTFHVLRCRDWARIDVRCDSDGEPHVLE
ncbi:MAG: ATP-grasp domain-containing protein, partial [Rhodothermales bacterium]|nr:ATP-grasp domain-containing protein [Rhodothermales bacterium]